MTVTSATSSPDLLPRFYGLSTDTKPVDNTTIGAKFHETDTGKEFIYSGGEWIRLGLTTVEQAEAVVVEQVRPTDELLGEILTQMKISNAHLALITDEEELDGAID